MLYNEKYGRSLCLMVKDLVDFIIRYIKELIIKVVVCNRPYNEGCCMVSNM